MKLYSRLLLAISLLCALTGAYASAQTISPVIAKFEQAGKGKLAVINNSLQPQIVTLEAKSFSADPKTGRPTFQKLSPDIHVKLSTTSVRLHAQETYYIFYDATADKYPAWFSIHATFAPVDPHPGINVKMVLTHMVYMFQKEPVREEDIEIGTISYDPSAHIMHCESINHSDKYGRPLSIQFVGPEGKTEELTGYPFFPNRVMVHDYTLNIKWVPTEAIFRFEKFTVRHPVVVKTRSEDENTQKPSATDADKISSANEVQKKMTTNPPKRAFEGMSQPPEDQNK